MHVFRLLAAFAAAAPAAAHDCWIQPQSFAVAPATPLALTVFVGHAEYRQRWGVAANRVMRFDDIHGGKVRDRRAEVHTDTGDEDARLAFTGSGTHLLVLASTAAFSDLPAIRYTDFAKAEGLTAPLAYRTARGLNDTNGREIYSRRAKALVQVGAPNAVADRAVTRPVGLTLEIVPLHNPYTLADGQPLPVRVLYRGKPLAGALVKLTNLDFDAQPVAMYRTDAAGRTAFTVPRRGKWLINTIWSVPITGNPKADFETIFSSLTFGFGPLAR